MVLGLRFSIEELFRLRRDPLLLLVAGGAVASPPLLLFDFDLASTSWMRLEIRDEVLAPLTTAEGLSEIKLKLFDELFY